MSHHNHDELMAEVLEMWDTGLPRGQLTGWPSLDPLYTVAPGQWTLVTGTPNSGKSEWLDALMVNLCLRKPWRFFIYSPENRPLRLHASKILEKYVGKPFDPGPTERMTKDEAARGGEWMRGKFIFAKPKVATLEGIIEEAADHVSMAGQHMTGLVVDPWNQLEHNYDTRLREDQYISKALSVLIDFVRGEWTKYHNGNVHFWLVAHPKALQKDKNGNYPIPRPYDISGGAHWWNKADNCITVWRDQGEGSQEVEVHVQKVRFKHIGRIGLATLIYDRVTGKYHEQFNSERSNQYRRASNGDDSR